ncbi:MAG: rRNA maturation RNase YbeY [Planctomycetaceae bacterium]
MSAAEPAGPSPNRDDGATDDRRYEIEVNDAQARIDVDLDRLKAVADDVLRYEGVRSAEVSIALIDGGTMQRLNREHLGHDYDTDVLSFLLDSSDPATVADGRPRGLGKTLDGEILISTDVAAKVAGEFGWSEEDETTLYLIHGLLHLIGYDDLTDAEKAAMRQRERLHLARWNMTPAYHEDSGHDDSDAPAGSPPHDSHTGVRG